MSDTDTLAGASANGATATATDASTHIERVNVEAPRLRPGISNETLRRNGISHVTAAEANPTSAKFYQFSPFGRMTFERGTKYFKKF